jgi:hypothetical protein
MNLAMLNNEIALFQTFLNRSRSYFEFGSGGSTVMAASLVRGPVSTVDSSQEWLDKVRAEIPASPHSRRLIYADIGPTGDWGAPNDKSNLDGFLNYHDRVWANVEEPSELYLVDGRFRVACFCQIMTRMPSDIVVGVHDYRSRKNYHVVEAFARPIAEASDLTFFVRKNGVSPYQIAPILHAHRYVWD